MISQILTLLFTFGVSWIGFWMAARLRRDDQKSRHWPTVSGQIVERGLQTMETDARYFTPKIKYAYSVAGRQYAGEQVYRTGRVGSFRRSAQKLVDGLPQTVPVHYNPENPDEAFLLTEPRYYFVIAAVFGAGAFVWGLLQLIALVVN